MDQPRRPVVCGLAAGPGRVLRRARRRRTRRTGAEVADQLRLDQVMLGDIVRIILLCLPWKDANRFKCVSKHWLRLISEPSFHSDHKARSTSLLGFIYNDSHWVKFADLTSGSRTAGPDKDVQTVNERIDSLQPLGTRIATLGSNNGLVLHFHLQDEYFFLHNPVTAQTVQLPPAPRVQKGPVSPFFAYGLAVDLSSQHGKYSVVVELAGEQLDLRINRFSSENRSWTVADYKMRGFVSENYTVFGQSTFLNNRLHWLMYPQGILVYDVKTEVVFPIASPRGTYTAYCYCKMKIKKIYARVACVCRYLGESLMRLIYASFTGDSQISVWSLDNYNCPEWTVRHNVVIEHLPFPLSFGRFLGLHPHDPEVMFMRLKKFVFSYNVTKRELALVFDTRLHNHISFMVRYELPKHPPGVSPSQYLQLLFGDTLCYQGRCLQGVPSNGVNLHAHLHYMDGLRFNTELIQSPLFQHQGRFVAGLAGNPPGRVSRMAFMYDWTDDEI